MRSKLTSILCASSPAVLLGCVSGSIGTFGVITTREEVPTSRLLVSDVRGEHCVASGLVSYSKAIEDALAQVAGANVMTNATFSVHVLGFATCARVVGDAAVLE